MSKTTRIATVKTTGEQFIVKLWHDNKIYCWGQLVAYSIKNGHVKTTHSPDSKTFLKDFVSLEEVILDSTIVKKLYEQNLNSHIKSGKHVEISKSGNAKIYNSQEEAKIIKAQQADKRNFNKIIRKNPMTALNTLVDKIMQQ